MNIYQNLCRQLVPLYDLREAQAIVRMVLETRYGFTLTDIVCGEVDRLSVSEQEQLSELVRRLATGEPVQYVLGQSEFCGFSFHVEPGVLIPRPETEELCRWIISDCSSPSLLSSSEFPHRVLDVCTGSGCIALTLALSIVGSKVEGWDLSPEALHVAQENVHRLEADNVKLVKCDALHLQSESGRWDVIVSNPPYICDSERAQMEPNVLEHEPSMALFVPDSDPLLFYRAIARYAAQSLVPNGCLYFEINPLYVAEMEQMLRTEGFACIETRLDSYGKKRMMKAVYYL